REDREAPGLSGRSGADGRDVHARRARGRRGCDEGQGVPGRRPAVRLGGWRRDPRLDVLSSAGVHRRLVRSLARVAGAPSARTHGRRSSDRAEPQRRAGDARAEPGAGARCGAGRQRLSRDGAEVREGEKGAAGQECGKEIAMPTVQVLDAKGKQAGSLELEAFGVEIRVPLLHQAVKRELNDRRVGTHDTKGRSEVSGGGRKPWKQKGTGRARQGSIRATQWKGGGKPFGPTPHGYDQAMPRTMRREALRAAVAAKLAAGELSAVETLDAADGKTKSLVTRLGALGIAGERTLLVVRELAEPLARAARNVRWLTVETPLHVSVYQLLHARRVIFERAGLVALAEALSK